MKKTEIQNLPNYKLWPAFAAEFHLDREQINDKAFGKSISELQKRVKEYGKKKQLTEKKESFLSETFAMPFKKNDNLEIPIDDLNIQQLKSVLKQKYKKCSQLKRKLETMEINETVYLEQAAHFSVIRKSLSKMIKSKHIVIQELKALKSEFSESKKVIENERSANEKRMKVLEQTISEDGRSLKQLNDEKERILSEKKILAKGLHRKSEAFEKLKLKNST